MRLRLLTERLTALWVLCVSVVVMLLTAVVAGALVHRSLPILRSHPLSALLGGSDWHPMQGQFGFRPFIVGTVWVTVLAMLMAVPVCLLAAIYLAEYARSSMRAVVRPLLDMLAGIPSVVYGLFGVLLLVPLVSDYLAPWAAKHLAFLPGATPREGYSTGYCLLTGAIVLAMMVAPVIISIADEVLRSVPLAMREASLSVGATRWETVKHVSVRFAAPGLVASVVLGFSRAFGETMAVLMVVGNVALSPKSVFDPAYPLPALIANNYGEMMSIPLYDSALLLAALILLVTVLAFNLIAQGVLVVARRRAAQ
jgi:phosphate transport system permease protein